MDLTTVTNANTVRSYLICMGQLRLLDAKVMTHITNWFKENSKLIQPRDLAAYAITTGTLNVVPEGSEGVYEVRGLIIPGFFFLQILFLSLFVSLR